MTMTVLNRESTGYKLFKTLFHCRVKAKHLVRLPDGSDDTGLLIRAIPTTGDPEYDAHLAESLNDVYLPASDIAELIDEGADVMIVKRTDVTRIYDIIQAHLQWWAMRLNQGTLHMPGQGEEITRDLKVLSNCADRLYPMLTEFRRKDDAAKPAFVMDVGRKRSYTEAITPSNGDHANFDALFDPNVLKQVHSWGR